MNWFDKISQKVIHKYDKADVEAKAHKFFQFLKAHQDRVILYHGTIAKTAEKIKQKGYMLATSVTGEGAEQQVLGKEQNHQETGTGKLFFTTSMNYAAMYANQTKMFFGEPAMTILKVQVPLWVIEEVRIAILFPNQNTYNENQFHVKMSRIFWTRKPKTNIFEWQQATTDEQKIGQLREFIQNIDPIEANELTVKMALKASNIVAQYNSTDSGPTGEAFWEAYAQYLPYSEDSQYIKAIQSNPKIKSVAIQRYLRMLISHDELLEGVEIPKWIMKDAEARGQISGHFIREVSNDPSEILTMPDALNDWPEMEACLTTAYKQLYQSGGIEKEYIPAKFLKLMSGKKPRKAVPKKKVINYQNDLTAVQNNYLLIGRFIDTYGENVMAMEALQQTILGLINTHQNNPQVLQYLKTTIDVYFSYDAELTNAVEQHLNNPF